jgi:hypothetical protein
MKTNYLMGMALAGLGLVSGCIIYSGSDGWKCKQQPPSPPPVVQKDTVMAEIDAVCKLGSDADRHDLLLQIAGRPHLSPPAQAHLVKMVRERLGSADARMDVLLMLAENPCLHDEGVRAIIAATDSLGSDANRRAVLDAIGRRQAHPPMPGPITVPGGPGFPGPGPGPGPVPVPDVPH